MSMTYPQYVARLTEATKGLLFDGNLSLIIPKVIDDAEQRIYRELNLTVQVKRDSATLTPSAREVALPTTYGPFRTVTGVNVITPAGTAATTGKRNPLVAVSRDVIDLLWPDADANTALPTQYATLDNAILLLGPSPDAAYVVEVIGTVRPSPLSASNTTTYLTTYLPDLFLAASMVAMAPWTKSDPAGLEAQYQTLKASAAEEESRRRIDSI